MEFEEITLEKYGVFETLPLSLGNRPGLVIIYGPNEAGKSTCLAAIADFLFGIPHNTSYGQVFGYDQMRLAATVKSANCGQQRFRRRKGRGSTKTLMDGDNQLVDEAMLSNHLGATTRERFEALFGLDHQSLRSGGERLLAADGDVGRLIVEAGGGLRRLVESLDAMRAESGKLFSPRRSADRAFYKALDVFDAADEAVKHGLLTRNDFDDARKLHESAVATLDRYREAKRSLSEREVRLDRLIRVIPMLTELDRVDLALIAYAALPPVRAAFGAEVDQSLVANRAATAALVEVDERREILEVQLNGLIAPTELLKAEPTIQDIAEKSAHIAKARGDRVNRQRELAEFEAKLSALRRNVGAGDDAALEDRLPEKSSIERVQGLIAQGVDLPARIAGLAGQIADDEVMLSRLHERQLARRENGQDEPFGIAATELTSLATSVRSLEAKRNQATRFTTEINLQLKGASFASLEDIRSFECPDAVVIGLEMQKRAVLEANLLEQESLIAAAAARLERAKAEIERLKTGGEVPSPKAIEAAREARHGAWTTVRDVFVDASADSWVRTPAESRGQAVSSLELRVADADAMADSRFAETKRVTALEIEDRTRTEAIATMDAATVAKRGVETRLEEAGNAWLKAWPNAVNREPDLGRLKALVEARSAILTHADSLRELRSEMELAEADVEPRSQMLAAAEATLGFSPERGTAIAIRVQAVTRSVVAHDGAHADYMRDVISVSDLSNQLERRKGELSGIESAHSKWCAEWATAVQALGLAADATIQRGNDVATQWATASGVLDGRATTLRRLQRMDDDEEELRRLIRNVAGAVDSVLPEDSVASARMLQAKCAEAKEVAIKHKSLAPQLEQVTREQARKRAAADATAAALIALSKEAGTDLDKLSLIANGLAERGALVQRKDIVLESITHAGDGYSLEILTEHRSGRDLDEIAAELTEIKEQVRHLDGSIDEAVGAVQEGKSALDRFATLTGINAAVADREGAAADLHAVVAKYVELWLASQILSAAVERIRVERQDPLIVRASELFSLATRGAFIRIETDVDDKGTPVVVAKRAKGETVSIGQMSDGTRDQLFLAFRLASVEHYCASAEPLPFIGDDLLVHFDDERSTATLDLLVEFGKTTQVLLFTHHRNVCDAATRLVAAGTASILELPGA